MVDTRKKVLEQQFAMREEDTLSPEEKNVLQYHRDRMKDGTAIRNNDGSLTTFMGAISDIDGKPTIHPTFFDGKVISPQEGARRAVASGIKWPQYKSVKQAEFAEEKIHAIMARDAAIVGGRR